MQKTAYEIKECDWSSDVCSSGLDEYLATSRELSALTSGEVAFALYPPQSPQNGIINLVQIATCRDTDRARELLGKQMQAALMGGIPTAPGI